MYDTTYFSRITRTRVLGYFSVGGSTYFRSVGNAVISVNITGRRSRDLPMWIVANGVPSNCTLPTTYPSWLWKGLFESLALCARKMGHGAFANQGSEKVAHAGSAQTPYSFYSTTAKIRAMQYPLRTDTGISFNFLHPAYSTIFTTGRTEHFKVGESVLRSMCGCVVYV
jgi:hypothetical protein